MTRLEGLPDNHGELVPLDPEAILVRGQASPTAAAALATIEVETSTCLPVEIHLPRQLCGLVEDLSNLRLAAIDNMRTFFDGNVSCLPWSQGWT